MDGYQNSQGNGSHGAGALLARARRARRLSQMDLALETGISTRHLSFVETGRSRPSPGLVLRLCEVLGVPPREADGVLLAAGHAPAHRETPLEAPAMAEVLAALRLMLERHDPLPAVAFDAGWDIVMFNPAYGGALDACLAGGGGAGGGAWPPAPPGAAAGAAAQPAAAALPPRRCPPLHRQLAGGRPRPARPGAAGGAAAVRRPGQRRPPIEEALAQPGVARAMRATAARPRPPRWWCRSRCAARRARRGAS